MYPDMNFSGENSGALEAIGRIAGGFASHTLYTAVVTVRSTFSFLKFINIALRSLVRRFNSW